MTSPFIYLFGLIILTVGLFFGWILNKVPENEKWVVTRLGQTTIKGPGRFIQIPFIDHVVKVDLLSEEPTKIQDQVCITKDLVPVILHVIIYSRAVEPVKYSSLTKQNREDFVLLSSSTLKEIVSNRLLDEVLSERDKLGSAVCDRLNSEIDPAMGMKIEKVKIIDMTVPKKVLDSMSGSLANAPAICPGCGAPINRRRLKGAGPIQCEYCGYLIKRTLP
jgi:regulator of protease activity HflC (stomatin/prohibitin superfamily)